VAFHFIDPALAAFVGRLGLPVTDVDAVNLLFAGTLTLPGIVMASVAAGFGEEVSIRGLLQPRFGILLPALLFASLHAFQYSWDGLISVFLAGIIFACIRRYSNTTTSAITHTVYDLVLFSLLMAGISF
jgi:membrane protease YdiL (CAAX protease family)